MKLAVMQPYLFPYIPYFSLIRESDIFCFLDDVNFINKGWINRNYIVNSDGKSLFTIPLKNKSQNKLICNHEISDLKIWQNDFIKKLDSFYSSKKYNNLKKDSIKEIVLTNKKSISQYNIATIESFSKLLSLNKTFIKSSDLKVAGKGQERIINICNHLGVTEYINPIGGFELYNKKEFNDKGINLNFLKSKNSIESLSIIDEYLNNNTTSLEKKISDYELI
jgi:hypothetical protein